MIVETQQDMKALRRVGKVVALARDEMAARLQPGITTGELDVIGAKILAQYGARSAPRVMYNFPGSTCISINDEVAHGIPGNRVIQPGDMVNIDVSAELDGYYADTGVSLIAGPAAMNKQRLCDCARVALGEAIAKARTGSRQNQLGKAIYREAQRAGFTVIKNLCGHGIGRSLHEEPNDIINYYEPFDQRTLARGLVLALESFVSAGAEYVVQQSDGWTLKTPDGSLVAQYEHTLVVQDDQPVIITVL